MRKTVKAGFFGVLGLLLVLTACGGGGGGGTAPTTQFTKTVSGTVTYGSARVASVVRTVSGATVTVLDANGSTISIAPATTNAQGQYTVQVRLNVGAAVHAFVRAVSTELGTIESVIPTINSASPDTITNVDVNPVTNQQAEQYRAQLQGVGDADKNAVPLENVPVPDVPDQADIVAIGITNDAVEAVGHAVVLVGDALIQGMQDADAASTGISFTSQQLTEFRAAYYKFVGQLIDIVMADIIANNGQINQTTLITALVGMDQDNVDVMFTMIGLDTEKFFNTLVVVDDLMAAMDGGLEFNEIGPILSQTGLSSVEEGWILGLVGRYYGVLPGATPTTEEVVDVLVDIYAINPADEVAKDNTVLILNYMVAAVEASYAANKTVYDAAAAEATAFVNAVSATVDTAEEAAIVNEYLATKGFSEDTAYILDTYR